MNSTRSSWTRTFSVILLYRIPLIFVLRSFVANFIVVLPHFFVLRSSRALHCRRHTDYPPCAKRARRGTKAVEKSLKQARVFTSAKMSMRFLRPQLLRGARRTLATKVPPPPVDPHPFISQINNSSGGSGRASSAGPFPIGSIGSLGGNLDRDAQVQAAGRKWKQLKTAEKGWPRSLGEGRQRLTIGGCTSWRRIHAVDVAARRCVRRRTCWTRNLRNRYGAVRDEFADEDIRGLRRTRQSKSRGPQRLFCEFATKS